MNFTLKQKKMNNKTKTKSKNILTQNNCNNNNNNNKNPLASTTNDVELIVRKKLITTTTTTTMSPIDSNSYDQSSIISLKEELDSPIPNQSELEQQQQQQQQEQNLKKNFKLNNSVSCIDFRNSATSNDMAVTTTINQQKANPTSTADAVAALLNDSKRFGSDHNVIFKSSSSNHTIVSNENNGATTAILASGNNSSLTLNNTNIDNNTKLMSTVKKEQLEYEFRLKPRFKSSKQSGLQNETDEFLNDQEKLHKTKSTLCKCCNGFLSESSSSESSSENDDGSTSSEHKNPTIGSHQKKTKNNKKLKKIEDEECNNLDAEKKSSLIDRVAHFLYFYCCCCFCNLFKCLYSKKQANLNTNSSLKPNQLVFKNQKSNELNNNNINDDNKIQCENQSDILNDIQSTPPVSCIRVLRPSNDLTPVRFDSHYNIIQALNDQLNGGNPLINVDIGFNPSLVNGVGELEECNFDYEYKTC